MHEQRDRDGFFSALWLGPVESQPHEARVGFLRSAVAPRLKRTELPFAQRRRFG